MRLTASARRVGDGLRNVVVVDGRHTIVTDEPESLGGTNAGPAPHALLPAALASCVSTMIAMYAQARGWELGEIEVDVDYDTGVKPRTVDVEVRIPAALSPGQLARLERVAETCPVRRALESEFEFQERIRAAAPAPSEQAA